MSDVEKTISGLSDGELKQQSCSTTIDNDLSTKVATASTLKYQHQHQHQQQHNYHKYNDNRHEKFQQQQQQQQQQQKPSINYYCNNASGSAILTDSTVDETPSCRNNCISRILKIIFSTPGLVLLVIVYSVMGALIFPLLEAQQDITKSAAIAKSREDCLRELWIITEKLNVLYERNWTMLVHEQLRRFEGSIVAATRNGGAGLITTTTTTGVKNGQSTALGHFGGNLDAWDQGRWSFSEALLYSVTVITTIGHGSLTPKTPAGKIATILYALIGVPLMLMCLSSLGALLAEALQCTYAKLCCHRRRSTDIINRNGNKRQDRAYADENHQQENESKCHGKGQGLNCKGCKYDAIVRENRLHNEYEYNESNNASEITMAHCSNEDSCRLLHNSPKAKLNYNSSPCMQIEMMPQNTATIAQYYHQQKQQQQSSYNRIQSQPGSTSAQSDVMLLGATETSTTTNTTTTANPETISTATSATMMARSNVSSSPQNLPHQLQPTTTTFHIVSNATSPQLSSSTHSSPLHYSNHQHQNNNNNNNNNHHHISPPNLFTQQFTMRQCGSNVVPQHFVAIPSSMVRFQVAPTNRPSINATKAENCTFSNVGNNGIPPNCYQPTASTSVNAVTGAATIYFPIAGTIAAATTTMPRTAASTIGGASSRLLCNQPIVKYHTIQLQHKKNDFNDEVATSGSTSTIIATPLSTLTSTATATATAAATATTEATCHFNVADTLPLPPPPAYQTATVHGVRRAKFIAKPLLPEINNLLAESDVNTPPFRRDLSAVQQNNLTTTPTTTATATTTTLPLPPPTISLDDSVLLLSTGCTTTMSAATTSMLAAHNLTTAKEGARLVTLPTNTNTTSTISTAENCTFNGSNVTVDIMEDEEEEQEQQRLGNCPHGTPSRMPLIPNSNTNCSGSNPSSNNTDGKHCSNINGNDRDYDKSKRGLINTKAASFHRHTLQTFQRNAAYRNNRKSTLVTTHQGGSGGNNMHTPTIWMRRASTGCYGSDPNADTSEDDDYLQQTHNEHYALEQLNNGNFSEDINDADETDDEFSQCPQNVPQVPISIVLLILACYVSLGTVIFALWENWSLIDGAYFCFVTLATIGYGDFLPERTFQGPEVQLFACCAYLLLGLVLVAMSFSILETQLIWKCKRIAVRLRLATD